MVMGDELLAIAKQFRHMTANLETGLSLAVELEKTGRLDTETAQEYVADYIAEFLGPAWARINRMHRIQRKFYLEEPGSERPSQ